MTWCWFNIIAWTILILVFIAAFTLIITGVSHLADKLRVKIENKKLSNKNNILIEELDTLADKIQDINLKYEIKRKIIDLKYL